MPVSSTNTGSPPAPSAKAHVAQPPLSPRTLHHFPTANSLSSRVPQPVLPPLVQAGSSHVRFVARIRLQYPPALGVRLCARPGPPISKSSGENAVQAHRTKARRRPEPVDRRHHGCDMLDSGRLAEMIAELSVTGLTSNPTDLQKGRIRKGTDYDAAVETLSLVAVERKPCSSSWHCRLCRAPPSVSARVQQDRRRRRLRLARGLAAARLRHAGDDRRGRSA